MKMERKEAVRNAPSNRAVDIRNGTIEAVRPLHTPDKNVRKENTEPMS